MLLINQIQIYIKPGHIHNVGICSPSLFQPLSLLLALELFLSSSSLSNTISLQNKANMRQSRVTRDELFHLLNKQGN